MNWQYTINLEINFETTDYQNKISMMRFENNCQIFHRFLVYINTTATQH